MDSTPEEFVPLADAVGKVRALEQRAADEALPQGDRAAAAEAAEVGRSVLGDVRRAVQALLDAID